MSTEFIRSNKSNILILGILIFGLMLHLFLGQLILGLISIQSLGILIGVLLLLTVLHLTFGGKLYHNGGARK